MTIKIKTIECEDCGHKMHRSEDGLSCSQCGNWLTNEQCRALGLVIEKKEVAKDED